MAYVHTKRAKNSEEQEVTGKYYLSNSKLLPEVLEAKKQGKMTNELAKMLMMLARKYAQRPCFSGYSYKEDMISEALASLCQNALKFNPEKSNNPFSFYTTCINNSFLHFLNIEKKHRKIRDQLLIDIGENPSFNFQEEVRQQSGENADYKSELEDLKNQISDAHVRLKNEEIYLAKQAALLAAENAALEIDADVLFDQPNITTEALASLLDFGDGDVEPDPQAAEFIEDDNEEKELIIDAGSYKL